MATSHDERFKYLRYYKVTGTGGSGAFCLTEKSAKEQVEYLTSLNTFQTFTVEEIFLLTEIDLTDGANPSGTGKQGPLKT